MFGSGGETSHERAVLGAGALSSTGARHRLSALSRFRQILGLEQERWFYWLPVLLSFGIGLYFYLPYEPDLALLVPVIPVILGLAFLLKRSMLSLLLLSSLLAISMGFGVAKLRTEYIRAPIILSGTGSVEVEGWIERIEKRSTGGYRVSMVPAKLGKYKPALIPKNIRIFVRLDEFHFSVGDYVATVAFLRPPPGPALPGGYDFARAAFYRQLGGVGFNTQPFVRGQPDLEPSIWFSIRLEFEKMRDMVGVRIKKHLDGQASAVAIALLTGRRDEISPDAKTALRHSGLAHILAISGLHMALMSGSVFWLIRAFLALLPGISLRWPIKKWSAVLAIFGALFYLSLSGGSAATQRAFLMVCLLYVAVLLDRPALSLRNVAIAALIILVFWPESMLNIGFQMSFAAVTALIAFYESWNAWFTRSVDNVWRFSLSGKIFYFFAGIALTTIVAGLAIAPLSAYHFGREAGYSLLANLLALPIFSFVTMPMALVSLLAMPLGFEAVPLQLMGWGVEVILAIAAWVSNLPGAVLYIAAVPQYAAILVGVGALWLMIWRRPWRYLGLIIIGAGLAFFGGGIRPDIHVSDNGRTIAVRNTQAGDGSFLLSAPKGSMRSYALARWLEKDGDARPPKIAARGLSFKCDASGCVTSVKNMVVAYARSVSSLKDDCQRADILIARFEVSADCPRPRLIIDRTATLLLGAHAVYIDGDQLVVDSVEGRRARRPWSRR